MKKRLLLFLCIFTLLLSTAAQAEDVTADVPAPAPSAEKADTLSPFARTRSYDGRFTDVDASAWYHDAVAALYEYGLTEGVSSSAYAPEGSVTIAELVTFAARLRTRLSAVRRSPRQQPARLGTGPMCAISRLRNASATSLTATIRRPRRARRRQVYWPPRSARSATTSATPRP
ncbi:MAG: S-layer homology domain-containing protein [Oscillospiraceae bacterium]